MTRIEAAGGVLWRPADTRLGLEVALVHRPGCSAWSLPKGKLLPGEHAILGALREVREETGHPAFVGPALGATQYQRNGKPKRVRYWSLAARDGTFTMNREVDDLIWLPPDAARQLARRRDQPIIDRFWRLRPDRSRPLLFVRPGSLKSHWGGCEAERPLDSRGRRQASALAQLLTAFDIRHAVVADLRRCTETLGPLTTGHSGEHQAIVSVEHHAPPTPATLEQLTALTRDGVPTVVCAEWDLLAQLSRQVSTPRHSATAKLPRGSACVMHLEGRPQRRILAFERLRAAV